MCCRILVALAGHGRLHRPLQRRYLFQRSGFGADSDKVYRDTSVSSSGTGAHDDGDSGTGPPPQPGGAFGMATALDRHALAATLHPAPLTSGRLASGPPPPAASLHSDQGSSQLSLAQQVCSANCQSLRECVAEKQRMLQGNAPSGIDRTAGVSWPRAAEHCVRTCSSWHLCPQSFEAVSYRATHVCCSDRLQCSRL